MCGDFTMYKKYTATICKTILFAISSHPFAFYYKRPRQLNLSNFVSYLVGFVTLKAEKTVQIVYTPFI